MRLPLITTVTDTLWNVIAEQGGTVIARSDLIRAEPLTGTSWQASFFFTRLLVCLHAHSARTSRFGTWIAQESSP
jgi:hypothetical protein